MRSLEEHSERESRGHRRLVVALCILAVLGGALLLVWYRSHQPVDQGVSTIESAPASRERASGEVTPAPPAREAPSTGTLAVRSSLDGATVFLDGRELGEAPRTESRLEPGTYRVRVEKPGYQAFERRVEVRAGRRSEIVADLEALTALLRVESDVTGASVFVDQQYRGTTPLELTDLEPGPHELTVSAEGHEVYAESVNLTVGAPRDVVIRFKEARLDAAVEVVHKHTFGSCNGRLVADTNGLRYVTSNTNDAFSVPFTGLEEFQVDYMEKNLRVKVKGGRRYNFTEKSGNADALFVFHRDVEAFTAKAEG